MHAEMKPSRASRFHWKLLPLIVKVLYVCDIAWMTLTADSSMFRSMSSDKIRSTFGSAKSLHSLTYLRLEMSRLDYHLDGTWHRTMPLEAATSFNAFLACAVNLEELVLCYNDWEIRQPYSCLIEYAAQWPPASGDADWLQDVLEGQQWAKLKKFELRGFPVAKDLLLRFLKQHKDSVLDLKLVLDMSSRTKARLTKCVRKILDPRNCNIDFGRYPIYGDDDYDVEYTDTEEDDDSDDTDDLSDGDH